MLSHYSFFCKIKAVFLKFELKPIFRFKGKKCNSFGIAPFSPPPSKHNASFPVEVSWSWDLVMCKCKHVFLLHFTAVWILLKIHIMHASKPFGIIRFSYHLFFFFYWDIHILRNSAGHWDTCSSLNTLHRLLHRYCCINRKYVHPKQFNTLLLDRRRKRVKNAESLQWQNDYSLLTAVACIYHYGTAL